MNEDDTTPAASTSPDAPNTMTDKDVASKLVGEVLPPDPDVVANEAGVNTPQPQQGSAPRPQATVSTLRTTDGKYAYPPQAEWIKYELGSDGYPVRRKDNKGWRLRRGPVKPVEATTQGAQQSQAIPQAQAIANNPPQASQQVQAKRTITPIQLANIIVGSYVGAHVNAFGDGMIPQEFEAKSMTDSTALYLETEGINPPPWAAMLLAFGSYSVTHVMSDPKARGKITGMVNKLMGKGKAKAADDNQGVL